MYSEEVEYTQESLDESVEKIESFSANYGGTEIYQPMEYVFTNKLKKSNLSKHVYLITDGAVSNPDALVELILKNNEQFTVHAFGIGDGASTSLVKD